MTTMVSCTDVGLKILKILTVYIIDVDTVLCDATTIF